MPGYLPAMICSFNALPFGPPAISTNVGSQSSDAKMSLKIVPGLMAPGQRMTHGARMPPSHVVSLPPLNGVTPPSGKVSVLGAVVGCEDDDRVVQLAHIFELFST